MKIELRKIAASREFHSEILRRRAESCSKPPMNRQFMALADGEEVAFVSIDVSGVVRTMCIYELLVEPSQRGRGVGSAIVGACTEMARSENCERIAVVPRPLEPGGSEERLKGWYGRLGFVPAADQDDLLEISLARTHG